MLLYDEYKTVLKKSEGLFKGKGSKFIAYIFPISKESDIKTLVAALKAEHVKARHFCWAFRISKNRNIFRFNDDGEPNGTAGRPILNTLLSSDITNVLLVVVRYFGGALLGIPGLIHAYKSATQDALNNAEIIYKTNNDSYLISFSYLQMNNIMAIIKQEEILIKNQNLKQEYEIEVEIRKSIVDHVLSRFNNLGNVKTRLITQCN